MLKLKEQIWVDNEQASVILWGVALLSRSLQVDRLLWLGTEIQINLMDNFATLIHEAVVKWNFEVIRWMLEGIRKIIITLIPESYHKEEGLQEKIQVLLDGWIIEIEDCLKWQIWFGISDRSFFVCMRKLGIRLAKLLRTYSDYDSEAGWKLSKHQIWIGPKVLQYWHLDDCGINHSLFVPDKRSSLASLIAPTNRWEDISELVGLIRSRLWSGVQIGMSKQWRNNTIVVATQIQWIAPVREHLECILQEHHTALKAPSI